MDKRFVLISTTRGDELIRPSQNVVADSGSREKLEILRDARAKERAEYLAVNPLPWWVEAGIISSEEIKEIDSI
jgi:hypothetical protein